MTSSNCDFVTSLMTFVREYRLQQSTHKCFCCPVQLLVVVSLTSSFRAFEMFILTTIFANCIALAINTPYPESDSDAVNAVLVSFLCFLSLFFM